MRKLKYSSASFYAGCAYMMIAALTHETVQIVTDDIYAPFFATIVVCGTLLYVRSKIFDE